MDLSKVPTPTLARFIQSHVVGLEGEETGKGWTWAADFVKKPEDAQRRAMNEWLEQMAITLDARREQEQAALDAMAAAIAKPNGNRAERRAAVKGAPKVPRPTRAVKP